MTTTPPATAPADTLPPFIESQGGPLLAALSLRPGKVLCWNTGNFEAHRISSRVPSGAILRQRPGGGTLLDTRLIHRKLLEAHAVRQELANCLITAEATVTTRAVPTGSPLVMGLCESSVITQDIPRMLRACEAHICESFATENVPRDSLASAGHPAGIDGYVTLDTMARIVCFAQWCAHSAVIGCGYGEMVALFLLSGRETCIGFETFESRRNTARAVAAAVGYYGDDTVPLYGDLGTYNGAWPAGACMIWCNNYRFNDDPGSCIPQTLLTLPRFPVSTSVLMCMVPFAGEVDVAVCICGNCYEGFCDHRGVPGCFIVRPCEHNLVAPPRCGVCRGFAQGDRVILRAPDTDVQLQPYGAGSGVRSAVVYQLFTCAERPPTPHTGIVYDKLVLRSPSDVTDALLRDLEFVARSGVVGGALADHSLIFNGVDGEEYGIDAAIAFTSKEPGEEPLIYAYRTLARIRDCEMPHVLRINQDVVRSSMQGRSFINQANLLTAQVIRAQFPDVTHVVIEPDREVGYHRNYTTHGFLWRLQQNLVATEKPPVRRRSVLAYRKQIELCPHRYPSLWFEVPVSHKRPREGPHGSSPL